MSAQKFGITFPFADSPEGFFLNLNGSPDDEIRSNLVHLIMTAKGSRYFLPDFGTRLMSYMFQPLDQSTRQSIDREIRESVKKYIPGLIINEVTLKSYDEVVQEEKESQVSENIDDNYFGFSGDSEREYTLRLRIDYTINDNNVFETKDFIILNI